MAVKYIEGERFKMTKFKPFGGKRFRCSPNLNTDY